MQCCDQVSRRSKNGPLRSSRVEKESSESASSRAVTRSSSILDEVDDAEVDLADGIRLIIDQGDDGFAVAAFEIELFGEFAGDGGVVGGGAGAAFTGVDGIDVTADADGDFRVEAAFATGLAAGVVEHAVAMAEHAIGDELLVAGSSSAAGGP